MTSSEFPGPDLPDIPDVGPLPASSSSSLPVLNVPAYDLVYLTDTTAFVIGDTPALQWTLSESEGGTAYPPSAVTLFIERPDGLTDTDIVVYLSTAAPAISIELSAFYKFLLQGVYTLILQITINDTFTPIQVRSCTTIVTVT